MQCSVKALPWGDPSHGERSSAVNWSGSPLRNINHSLTGGAIGGAADGPDGPDWLSPGHDVRQLVHGPDGLHTPGPLPPGLELLELDRGKDLPAHVLLHEEGVLQTLTGRQPVPAAPPQQVGDEVLTLSLCSVLSVDHYLGIQWYRVELRLIEIEEDPDNKDDPWSELKVDDLLDDVAEGLGVAVPHEGREAWEKDVGDDPNRPHVGGGSDVLVAHHLRGHELRGPAHGLHLLARHDDLGGAEVDDLDSVRVGADTDHVLWLEEERWVWGIKR